MPPLESVLDESNALLRAAGLPPCSRLEPVADGDTRNPSVMGYAADRRYAIKVSLSRPHTLALQAAQANWFGRNTDLPVPRHLAHTAGEGSLPLLVTEWMPGEQLRLALPKRTPEDGAGVAYDWGRCLALLHTAPLPAELYPPNAARATGYWGDAEQYGEALQLAERVGAACRPDLSGRMVLFLEERVEAFRQTETGLTKADCDTRDFLVGRPARISAMLDWEQVHCGFVLHQCLQAHLRLKAMGLEELFVPFCRGYEGVTGERLAQSPAVEYCFMARTLRAVGNNIPGALETVTALAAGQPLPFG